jgi:hypothetical protein
MFPDFPHGGLSLRRVCRYCRGAGAPINSERHGFFQYSLPDEHIDSRCEFMPISLNSLSAWAFKSRSILMFRLVTPAIDIACFF